MGIFLSSFSCSPHLVSFSKSGFSASAFSFNTVDHAKYGYILCDFFQGRDQNIGWSMGMTDQILPFAPPEFSVITEMISYFFLNSWKRLC